MSPFLIAALVLVLVGTSILVYFLITNFQSTIQTIRATFPAILAELETLVYACFFLPLVLIFCLSDREGMCLVSFKS
jgi:hypothetical protein